ncbi:hypothetical protein C4544_05890 [candidate division WS5 bacterium]|uniref:Sulfotransferase domain-containing protein n=1 Tax=candidate division WS5 bacterium TaxID=2093353 RepID=A0A419DAV5_9BACT|nr:MAG: hypothetical protein C4544_05890 [candidate division WS5 bacterium]
MLPHLLKKNKNINYIYKKLKTNLIELKDTIEIVSKGYSKGGTLDQHINSWKRFSIEVRQKKMPLLLRLNEFPESVLISGCQRSGTTMLSRIITQSDGMVNFWSGRDDELDAALILSGVRQYNSKGRHCFQTTYVNECVNEYYSLLNGHMGHKLIWVLRNPFSVVFSMLYNWNDFALNELFEFCGMQLFNRRRSENSYSYLHKGEISRLERACFAYNGKTSQVFELINGLKKNTMMVIDYEYLINKQELILPFIYQHINIPYQENYLADIYDKSVHKYKMLSTKDRKIIESICMPVYEKAKSLSFKC